MSSPHRAKVRADKSLLRARSGREHSKVTSIELFFDLVFVFAITQLSHLWMEHFTPVGAVQTLLLMLAVWWVWIYTSWVTNWLDPEKLPVRFLLLAIMLAGLVMSSSLPRAFESRGIAFATAYVLIQVGRTVFFLWAVKGHAHWSAVSSGSWFGFGWNALGRWSICARAGKAGAVGPRAWFGNICRRRWVSGCRVLVARPRATGTSKATILSNGACFLSLSLWANPSW